MQIAIGPDGRLVISSQDTAALDLLEELLSQLAPPRKDFKVFPLKYASSLWVKLNLEDYFEEEPEDKNKRRNYYYFDYAPPQEKEKSYRLSQRKPLKFIDDLDTNTILVVGANAEQLKTIEELIRLWDTPPPSDTRVGAHDRRVSRFATRRPKRSPKRSRKCTWTCSARTTRPCKRAATTSGPATRRPTSSANPAAANRIAGRRSRSRANCRSASIPSPTRCWSRPKARTLMENVSKMIEALDEAAKPVSEVEVVTLKGNVNAERVRKVLAGMFGEKAVQPGQGAAANQPPGGPQPGQPGWGQPGPGPGR